MDYPQAQKILTSYGRSRLLKGGKNTAGLRDATSSESEGEDKQTADKISKKNSTMGKKEAVSRQASLSNQAAAVQHHIETIANTSTKKRKGTKEKLSIQPSSCNFQLTESPLPPIGSPRKENKHVTMESSFNDAHTPPPSQFSNTEYTTQSIPSLNNKTLEGNDVDSFWLGNLVHAHNEAIKSLQCHYRRHTKKELKRMKLQIEEQQNIIESQAKEIESLRLATNPNKVKKHGLVMNQGNLRFEMQRKALRIKELESDITGLQPSNQQDR